MQVVHDQSGLAPFQGCVFVPTMGALHAGHAALIRRARAIADSGAPVVVSVFVNPTQFNEPADFERYPRDLDRDVERAGDLGADCVFAPAVETIYPPGAPPPTPALPAVATEPGLEDAHRPGHFAGVCQVVRRLFELVSPRAAIFGEKDWQQLQVVRAMVEREAPGVEVIGHPTVREEDGLALSSRNALLDESERARATSLFRALRAAGELATAHDAERAMTEVMQEAGVGIDYAAVRDALTLTPLTPPDLEAGSLSRPARSLVAGRLGEARLIDNAPWPWA